MNDALKEKLEILRKRIPIGIRQGLTILEKTNGDIEKAEKNFQEQCLKIINNKTDVQNEIATIHLLKNNFDIELTLKSIDEERYSLTERIFRKYKNNKEEALQKLALAIEEKEKLTKIYWLQLSDLSHLKKEEFCLLAIIEWLNFEGWEDFSSAIYFQADIVTEQIENTLSLPQIANTLRKAKKIHQEQLEEQNIILEKKGAISPTPEFKKLNNLFEQQKPLLIETLYDFVGSHIDKFP